MLKEQLISWANKFENSEFIKNDPIQFPHRYEHLADIEISAFVTAWIAFGNRKAIIKKAEEIDTNIFEGEPYAYIMGLRMFGGGNETMYGKREVIGRDKNPKWTQYRGKKETFYRFFKQEDFYQICLQLNRIYSEFNSLQDAIKDYQSKLYPESKTSGLTILQTLFSGAVGIPDVLKESACKRLSMFLRWMVRKDSPVDFGCWDCFDQKSLLIPLDTHVHRMAMHLGITQRKSADIKTAEEITNYFRDIFPDDPCRGDFALFGYGIENKDYGKKRIEDLSVEEVVKSQLFFDTAKTEIENLWNNREAAREKAKREGMRLRAHSIDHLQKAGFLEVGKFIVSYATLLNNAYLGEYMPSAQRMFIRELGGIIFNKTMQKLVKEQEAKDEAKGNKSKRKD